VAIEEEMEAWGRVEGHRSMRDRDKKSDAVEMRVDRNRLV